MEPIETQEKPIVTHWNRLKLIETQYNPVTLGKTQANPAKPDHASEKNRRGSANETQRNRNPTDPNQSEQPEKTATLLVFFFSLEILNHSRFDERRALIV